MSNSVGVSSDVVSAYRQQIDTLGHASGATDEYKSQLEQWLQAIVNQMGADSGQGQHSVTPSASADRGAAAQDAAVQGAAAGSATGGSAERELATTPTAVSVPAGGNDVQLSAEPDALRRLDPLFAEAARRSGADITLLKAQCWAESRGDIGATSTNGGNGMTDTGLMQVNPGTFAGLQEIHPELRGRSLSDPETNIEAAGFLMHDLEQKFGSKDLALRAYNSGDDAVDLKSGNANTITNGLGDPNYVMNVNAFYAALLNGQALPA
ncbi:lytic transglycosylase domain-containing protein [Methylobacterium sp. J-076]|uniref:lytic transglycosylase domain-containing protein n=1 Tax=Methylobacterium sp. J-076 TaxID=2836655 RepID=UPI001FB9709D|nr:lytic transglycosylase domain-containing protein [Methylobacterium sp. J-076]MCJ2011297.1 lytic transglycosylase domain-containing protein [Methylobacterium sp. J-076]